MTMESVLLVLCFGLYCSAADLGIFFALTQATWMFFGQWLQCWNWLSIWSQRVLKTSSVCAEASQPQELAVGNVFD